MADDKLLKAASDALTKLAHHLLGEDWYSDYTDGESIYKDIVDTICRRYQGVKEDPVRKWRRRHKCCSFCNHFEPYPDIVSVIATGIGDKGRCRAKGKQVNYSRRRICRLFELKGKLK